jgi:tetratricopeptide (TPR) repeat protein
MRLFAGRGRAIGLVLVLMLVGGPLAAWVFLAESGPSDPDQLWQRADAEFLAGRYDRAEAALARLGRLRSPTPQDWYLRAKLAMTQNRTDEALADLDRIPDACPLGATARLRTGQIELRRNRWRRAEAALLAATRLDPKLVQPHRELIYIYSMQSRRAALNAQFRALSELSPLTFDEVFRWCLARKTNWEPREVIETATRCLRADPDDRWSRLALAEALRRVGRVDDAEAALTPLPELDPEARVLRVEIALDRGGARAAESLLAGENANHPLLVRLQGRMALARHDGPSALRHFRVAYHADPDDRDTLFGLAAALTLVGDAAAAAPYLAASRAHDHLSSLVQRAAASANRDDLKLLLQLGAACEAVHRLPEARAFYELAIQKDPLDAETQRSFRRVQLALAASH